MVLSDDILKPLLHRLPFFMKQLNTEGILGSVPPHQLKNGHPPLFPAEKAISMLLFF
jgi:hypothetical protein